MKFLVRRVLSTLRAAVWFPFLVLIVASVGFVGVHAPQHAQISPYDEYVYLDYLAKVPTQGFVRSGEETGELARNELACRGVLGYGSFGDGCNVGPHSRDTAYPYNGGTGADIYAPPFFWATWTLAQPFMWAGLSLLEAGRLVGGLWLGLGTSLLFALLGALRIPKWTAFGLSLFVIATPSIYWANTYLSTDAPTLAAASLVGLLAARVIRTGKGFVWLPSTAIVAVLFKIQNLVAVGLASIAIIVFVLVERLLAMRAARGAVPSRAGVIDAGTAPSKGIFVSTLQDRRTLIALAASAAGIISQGAWLIVRAKSTPPGAEAVKVDTVRLPLTVSSLVDESMRFIWTVGTTGAKTGLVATVAGSVIGLLAIAAVFGLILEARRRPKDRIIGWTTLAFSLVMGPALVLAASSAVGFYFPLPIRYGLVLLPAFVACIGLYLSRYSRRGSYAVAWVGIVFAGAAILFG